MEWLIVGFMVGTVNTACIFAAGWITHNRTIHKPAMRRAAAEHSNERAALMKRIGEMSERARKLEQIANEGDAETAAREAGV